VAAREADGGSLGSRPDGEPAVAARGRTGRWCPRGVAGRRRVPRQGHRDQPGEPAGHSPGRAPTM